MIYRHPLAYLIAMEGTALLRAWTNESVGTRAYVQQRIARTRALLDDERLAGQPGAEVAVGETAAAYAQWAERYDDPGNGLFDLDAPVIEDFLGDLAPGLALDVGCGTGRLSRVLRSRGHRVVGLDTSAEMLEQALSVTPDLPCLRGSMTSLPVADGAVSLVVSGLALSHVSDLSTVFTEFTRVLAPGGHLVISDVHPDLVAIGSAPVAVGPDGEPQQSTAIAHPPTATLRAALAAGLTVLRCDERPTLAPLAAPTEPPLPGPETDGDRYAEVADAGSWPWTLLSFDDAAVVVAWHIPSVIVWHFQRP